MTQTHTQPMTLDQFRATGRDVADLSTVHSFITDDGRPVPARLYAGDAYLLPMPAQDGVWLLILHNEEYVGALADMEARLYLWCLQECGGDMGMSEELATALCMLDNVVGFEELADLIANGGEQGTTQTELDNSADVNECAIAAWCEIHGMDPNDVTANHDGIDGLITDLYDLIAQNEFATDDTRSFGP